MVNCPNCSKALSHKEGTQKFCAQIDNPELADRLEELKKLMGPKLITK